MAVFTEAMLEVLRFPDPMPPSAWADRHRVLDAKRAAEPGRFDSGRTPYVREPTDSIAHWWVEQVTWMKSTQVGGSEALLNMVAWFVCEDPGPLMFVMPTSQ